MKIVFQYLKNYYGRMGLGFAIKVAGTLVELMLPYILSIVIHLHY